MPNKVHWRETLKLWLFGLLKIPMVFWLKPRVIEVSDAEAILQMPFVRRSKNHLNSMYFGVLCANADIVGGLHVMHYLKNRLDRFSFVFKDTQAAFLKRAEANVNFVSKSGRAIGDLIELVKQTHTRQNTEIVVEAYTVPNNELVASFKMTLSIKERSG